MHVSEVKRRFIPINRQKARLNYPSIHFVSRCNFQSAATNFITYIGRTSVCRSMKETVHLDYGFGTMIAFSEHV